MFIENKFGIKLGVLCRSVFTKFFITFKTPINLVCVCRLISITNRFIIELSAANDNSYFLYFYKLPIQNAYMAT